MVSPELTGHFFCFPDGIFNFTPSPLGLSKSLLAGYIHFGQALKDVLASSNFIIIVLLSNLCMISKNL
jgi:hypothetical protein